jgi:hypothetical protein
VHQKPFPKQYVQDLCSSKLCISSSADFVGAAQVPQLAMKVVENDTGPIDLHPNFGERY